MSEKLQHILEVLEIKTKYVRVLVKQINRTKRIPMLRKAYYMIRPSQNKKLKKIMTFKKWSMIWKLSEESMENDLIEVFTTEIWKDYMIVSQILEETFTSITVENNPTLIGTQTL